MIEEYRSIVASGSEPTAQIIEESTKEWTDQITLIDLENKNTTTKAAKDEGMRMLEMQEMIPINTVPWCGPSKACVRVRRCSTTLASSSVDL